jgi:hypothetical protein
LSPAGSRFCGSGSDIAVMGLFRLSAVQEVAQRHGIEAPTASDPTTQVVPGSPGVDGRPRNAGKIGGLGGSQIGSFGVHGRALRRDGDQNQLDLMIATGFLRTLVASGGACYLFDQVGVGVGITALGFLEVDIKGARLPVLQAEGVWRSFRFYDYQMLSAKSTP